MPSDRQENEQKWLASRRHLLKLMGAAGAAAVAGSMMPAILSRADQAKTGDPSPNRPPRQWVMVFDLRKCEGCVTTDRAPQCIEGCNAEHFVPAGQEWIKVLEAEGAVGHPYF
ncbi:MAG: twin-arginine translocation signal domain-containing protein, partial [Chloroflexi bacterium]|nr:twin-arginine translocation signal domain-containing protein [Chloroflexota bacterium]